ncbi:MAG: YczE/YyaS/YitT family protein [Actinomycetota bacterium]
MLVLLCWIPLKQRPGLGTLSNALVVGPVIALSLQVLPEPRALGLRGALLVLGIVLNGVATGLYIGAGLGPGPRDGLMTGLAARGHSIRAVRTAIELAVLTTGWLLGGSVGVGTVLYGVSIGPLAHVFIPLFSSTGPQKVAVECDSVLDRPSASRKEGQSCVAWGSS